MNNLETTLERVGRILSTRYGITVICKGNECKTDGKVIYLPALPDEIPPPLMGAIRAYLDHEVGHILGESDFKLAGKFTRKHGKAAFGVLNVLEDLRVDEVMRKAYAGSGYNLHSGFVYTLDEMERCGEKPDVLQQILTAIYSRGSNEEDIGWLEPACYKLADMLHDDITACRNAPDTKSILPIAEKVWQIIKENLPTLTSKTEGESINKGKPEKDGKPVTGQEEDGGKISDTGKPSEEKGSSSAPGKNDKNKEQDTGNKDPVKAGADSSNGSPMSALGKVISEGVVNYARSNNLYRVWSTEHDRVITLRDTGQDASSALQEVMPHVGGLRQRLLQSLQAETRSRWLGDQEKGSINPKALHKLATGSSERVFRRKSIQKRKSTAITLLLDLSHSMRGRKLALSRKAVLVFCEALHRLNIPTSVIGFSTLDEVNHSARQLAKKHGMDPQDLRQDYRLVPLCHTIVKRFNEPWRLAAGRLPGLTTQSLTPLGESLLFAARNIQGRPEERRIIICLTDGKPIVGQNSDGATFTHAKDSIKRIEKAGMEVLLIGIMESCVSRLHHRHVVVNNLDELSGTIIKQLQPMVSAHILSLR